MPDVGFRSQATAGGVLLCSGTSLGGSDSLDEDDEEVEADSAEEEVLGNSVVAETAIATAVSLQGALPPRA